MSESHTIRCSTKANFREKVEQIHLPRNASSQYHHDDLALFILALHRELKGHMNSGSNRPVMKGLLRISTNAQNLSAITAIKTKNDAMIDTILKAARAEADSLSTETKNVKPEITLRSKAREEAEAHNIAMQAILRTKEGVAKGLATKLGHNVTGGVLLTTDNAHYKCVDDLSHQLEGQPM